MKNKNEIIKILKKKIVHREQISQALILLELNNNICEVGVRTGKNFSNLINSEPDLIVAVDIWSEVKGKPEFNDLNLTT